MRMGTGEVFPRVASQDCTSTPMLLRERAALWRATEKTRVRGLVGARRERPRPHDALPFCYLSTGASLALRVVGGTQAPSKQGVCRLSGSDALPQAFCRWPFCLRTTD
eukprot:146620-Alexandrium_andersonii.AAC.1